MFLQILFSLFPYCGLQVIVSFGAHLLIAILTGLILAQILTLNKKSISKVLLSMISILVMFILQAQTYTQDTGAPTLIKIKNSIAASLNYAEIMQSEYLRLNQEEKIVYNSKFNKEYDKEFIRLENMDSKKEYFLTRKGNILFYDRTKLEIYTISNPNLIIEIDSNGNLSKHEIGKIESLLRMKHGGHKRWSIQKFDTELVGYEKILDNINRKKIE